MSTVARHLALVLVLSARPIPLAAQVAAPSAPIARQEPSVSQLVAMVKRAAQHIDPARIRVLVRRARLAGLAPTLKLSAERGLKQDLSSSSTASDAERLAAAIGDNLKLEASLTFDLARLVFAPEEVRLLSVERWLSGDQRKLVDEAVRLYFQRRKLILERQRSPNLDSELELNIEEHDALLDAMTAGAFGKALQTRPR